MLSREICKKFLSSFLKRLARPAAVPWPGSALLNEYVVSLTAQCGEHLANLPRNVPVYSYSFLELSIISTRSVGNHTFEWSRIKINFSLLQVHCKESPQSSAESFEKLAAIFGVLAGTVLTASAIAPFITGNFSALKILQASSPVVFLAASTVLFSLSELSVWLFTRWIIIITTVLRRLK